MKKHSLSTFRALLAAFCLGAAVATSATSAEEKRTALVIGAGEYIPASNLEPVPTAGKDAKLMAYLLRKADFEVIEVPDANLANAKGALGEFLTRIEENQGVGLLYFTGHGVAFRGANYLLLNDTVVSSIDELPDKALSLQAILKAMQDSGASKKLAFIDCCRNELFPEEKSGLADVELPQTFVGFSTTYDRSAISYERFGSVYTYFLTKHFTTPKLSAVELHQLASRDLSRNLGEEQIPMVITTMPKPFVFFPKTTPVAFEDLNPGAVRNLADLNFAWCPPGSFTMGSPYSEITKERVQPYGWSAGFETQLLTTEHRYLVQLHEGFWMGQTEVTQGQWKDIMGSSIRTQLGEPEEDLVDGELQMPMIHVSWGEAQAFCQELNNRFGKELPEGFVFTLPTGAQWEYACRAGSTTAYSWGGDDYKPLGSYANYDPKYAITGYDPTREGGILIGWVPDGVEDTSAKVASYRPNPWNLYDMHGNVAEWCLERAFSSWKFPAKKPSLLGEFQTASEWYPTFEINEFPGRRVARGGSWADSPVNCRSGSISPTLASRRSDTLGFRVVISVSDIALRETRIPVLSRLADWPASKDSPLFKRSSPLTDPFRGDLNKGILKPVEGEK